MSGPDYQYCTTIVMDDPGKSVRLVALSVNAPFRLIQNASVLDGCTQLASSEVPVCAAGNTLSTVHVGAGSGNSVGCRLGITLARIPPTQVYSSSVRMTFYVDCTDTAGPVCSDEEVVARTPSADQPVTARWYGDVPITNDPPPGPGPTEAPEATDGPVDPSPTTPAQ